ncbi:MAG TPA: hypothetical protein PKC76_16365 [Saprospiraceae bacterium]|nr:hypothetical protein [Saprospiraceae bacterium]HMP25707.1 hypothetical protein [Saprospiraceae bacterium]
MVKSSAQSAIAIAVGVKEIVKRADKDLVKGDFSGKWRLEMERNA